MSDDGDKKQGAVDLKRRDFLRGGFFRRALVQQKEEDARTQAQAEQARAHRENPVRPPLQDHRAYLGPNDDDLTEEEQLAMARTRARAMLGTLRPPEDQQPLDVLGLLDILASEGQEDPAPPSPDAPLIAQIDPLLCLAHQRSFCTVCIERCPVPDALVLKDQLPRIQPDYCTACGDCIQLCPAPINAIRLIPAPTSSAPHEQDRNA